MNKRGNSSPPFAAAMKTALLFLLALTSSVSAFSKCRCALFVTTSIGEIMLYELPGIDVGSCSDDEACKTRCTTEFTDLTSGGDLYHMIDEVTSVGQFLCSKVHHPVYNQFVYSYYELCNGPWQWDGAKSQELLCCSLENEQFPCYSL